MRLKTFAVMVVALALTPAVNAAISASDANSTVDSVELFLVAWDASGNTNNTYVQDLGIDPASQDWSNGNQSVSLDSAGFNSLFSNPADVRYSVMAGGVTNPNFVGELWFTGDQSLDVNSMYGGAQAQTNFLGALGNITAFVGASEHSMGTIADNNVSTATAGVGSVPEGLTYGGFLVDSDNVDVPNSALLGDALGFYNIAVDFQNNFSFIRTAFQGSWLLDANLNLSYSTGGTPPIPLPAGVWLLGTILAGFVGVSRRRRTSAA